MRPGSKASSPMSMSRNDAPQMRLIAQNRPQSLDEKDCWLVPEEVERIFELNECLAFGRLIVPDAARRYPFILGRLWLLLERSRHHAA